MYKNSLVHYLTKYTVDIMFYVGIVCTIAVPFILPFFIEKYEFSSTVFMPFTITLILAGICAVYILWQLKIMFKTLLGGNPFVSYNVTCLRKCSVASFLISIIFVVKNIYAFGLMSAVVIILFGLVGLFCLTLKDIFKQAIAYKEENDWTV